MKRLVMIGLLMIGTAATAAAQQPPAAKDDIPEAYKPPKGMCRIWLKDVPPQQQPAPTDCAAAVKNVPPNGRVVFSDTTAKEKPKSEPITPAGAKGLTGRGSAPPITIPKKPPVDE